MAASSFLLNTKNSKSVHNRQLPAEPGWDYSVNTSIEGTVGFLETDPQFIIKTQINELRQKFHTGRHIRIRHLPTNVTHDEIVRMLSDFPIARIKLYSIPGAAGLADVFLEDTDMFDEFDFRHRKFLLRGHSMPVNISTTDNLLCIARLPLNTTVEQLHKLAGGFGKIKFAFLMLSENTGKNKGYGFVEYVNKAHGVLAKESLGNQPGLSKIWAEFVDPKIVKFNDLHSKCLIISNLPPSYCDMTDFRNRMSAITKPAFCQIAFKNGVAQNWGVCEFNTREEAEETMEQLLAPGEANKIRGQALEVAFYVPGVRASHILPKLTEGVKVTVNNGDGLLPNPQIPAIYKTVQNLRKHSPLFAHSLEKIMDKAQESDDLAPVFNDDQSRLLRSEENLRRAVGLQPTREDSCRKLDEIQNDLMPLRTMYRPLPPHPIIPANPVPAIPEHAYPLQPPPPMLLPVMMLPQPYVPLPLMGPMPFMPLPGENRPTTKQYQPKTAPVKSEEKVIEKDTKEAPIPPLSAMYKELLDNHPAVFDSDVSINWSQPSTSENARLCSIASELKSSMSGSRQMERKRCHPCSENPVPEKRQKN